MSKQCPYYEKCKYKEGIKDHAKVCSRTAREYNCPEWNKYIKEEITSLKSAAEGKRKELKDLNISYEGAKEHIQSWKSKAAGWLTEIAEKDKTIEELKDELAESKQERNKIEEELFQSDHNIGKELEKFKTANRLVSYDEYIKLQDELKKVQEENKKQSRIIDKEKCPNVNYNTYLTSPMSSSTEITCKITGKECSTDKYPEYEKCEEMKK